MLVRFETILKAAAATKGTASQCMMALGEQFDSEPILALAEALLVVDGITLAEYREIERNGFDFYPEKCAC